MPFNEESKQRVINEISQKVISGLTFTFNKPAIAVNCVESFTSLSQRAADSIRAHLVESLNSVISLVVLNSLHFSSAQELHLFESDLVYYIAGEMRLTEQINLLTGEGFFSAGLIDLYFRNTRVLCEAFFLPPFLLPLSATRNQSNKPPSLDFRVNDVLEFNSNFREIVSNGTLHAIAGIERRALEARTLAARAAAVQQEAAEQAAQREAALARDRALVQRNAHQVKITRVGGIFRKVATYNTSDALAHNEISQVASSSNQASASSSSSSHVVHKGFFNNSIKISDEAKESIHEITKAVVEEMILNFDATDEEVVNTLNFLLDRKSMKNCPDHLRFERIQFLAFHANEEQNLEYYLMNSLRTHGSLREEHRPAADYYLRQEIKKYIDVLTPNLNEALRA
ncbi:MAG: hypothetical protein EPN84_07885 [Legionella sp.]|nr:MAG: hypothetical protein EPN84_07885 [Legionella sp.]